ncbi:MAG: helix-turn-helix domain-containing protein [Desulfobulbus sp.]|nr:helix-turn-helix domain-containing protein [Desulfobulbus sp.]
MNNTDAIPIPLRIGKAIRYCRESRNLTLEQLASKAGITYQYLSGVENGRENFTIGVLERLAVALEVKLYKLVEHALTASTLSAPPMVNRSFFRESVPLPGALTYIDLALAMDRTQAIFHYINKNMIEEVGRPLQRLIQGNNFSGLVSNIFSDAMDQRTSFKHNHHQKYPDLICSSTKTGLEVKATIQIGKGGESHNGHSGWHTVVCFEVTDTGIEFLHVMFAVLNGHNANNPDWKYVGSKVNEETGSRRTETYHTNLRGTTKLRDGSAFLNYEKVAFARWRQERSGVVPCYSIFAKS